jgi:ribose 5-phosphate isomerase A
MNRNEQENWKESAGRAAAGLVEDGMVIGLGTGTTSAHLIRALGERVRRGLHIVGAVPTSQGTSELASSVGIPITDLDTHPELDLYIDGADEVDPQLFLIKGAGGALLREKIVASVSRRFTVIADATKRVERLGTHVPVPVEVTPFAATPARRRLEALGAQIRLRQINGGPFITENKNIILDCSFPGGIADPEALDAAMHRIVGVVETGLFLHMAQQAIIGGPQGAQSIP